MTMTTTLMTMPRLDSLPPQQLIALEGTHRHDNAGESRHIPQLTEENDAHHSQQGADEAAHNAAQQVLALLLLLELGGVVVAGEGLHARGAQLHIAPGHIVPFRGLGLPAVLTAGVEGLGVQEGGKGVQGLREVVLPHGPLGVDGDGDGVQLLPHVDHRLAPRLKGADLLLGQGAGGPLGGGAHPQLIGIAGVCREDGPGKSPALPVDGAAVVHLEAQVLGKRGVSLLNLF